MRWWRRPAADDLAQLPVLVPTWLHEWRYLDGEERHQLLADVEHLVVTKSWEAARRFELTLSVKTAIAAQAALVTLGLGVEEYRHVRAIVVHASTVVVRTPRPGPIPGTMDDSPMELIGEAHGQRGPVLLAWDAVRADLRTEGRWGHNVVIHEFVHKLDMLDGLVDGTPPLADPAARARWAAVSTGEYRALRNGEPDRLLREYAASDPGEFFAVAAEAFFTRPVELAAEKPELYRVYRDYFRQDPAARRGAARS